MRSVISYEAVADAADTLTRAGERPTNERVRALLSARGHGRGGSATTVKMHLDRWQDARPAGVAVRPPDPLPDEVLEAARLVRAGLEQSMSAKVAALELQTAAAVEAAQGQTAQARLALQTQEQVLVELRARVQASEAGKEAALTQAAAEGARREALEQALAESRQAAHDARAAVQAAHDAAHAQVATMEASTRSEVAARDRHIAALEENVRVLRADQEVAARAGVEERMQLSRRIDTLIEGLGAAQTALAERNLELSVLHERGDSLERQQALAAELVAQAHAAEGRRLDDGLRLTAILERLEVDVRQVQSVGRARDESMAVLSGHFTRLMAQLGTILAKLEGSDK